MQNTDSDYVTKLLVNKKRMDGRHPEENQKFELSNLGERTGMAKLTSEGAEVFAKVHVKSRKCDDAEGMTPDCTLSVHYPKTCGSINSDTQASRGTLPVFVGETSIQILLGSGTLKLESLKDKKSSIVFDLAIEVVFIRYEGSPVTQTVAVAVRALRNTNLEENRRLPVTHLPKCVTISMFSERLYLLDPTFVEQEAASAEIVAYTGKTGTHLFMLCKGNLKEFLSIMTKSLNSIDPIDS